LPISSAIRSNCRARRAATDADVIAFCGVKFMAETAKILARKRSSCCPIWTPGCSLEDSCPPEKFKAFPRGASRSYRADLHQLLDRGEGAQRHHRHQSSAETILSQIPPEQKIIFGPDRHLGGYLARKFGREMLLWPGVCIVHEAFSETELLKLKAQHPGAPVAAHPECPPHIIDHADYVGSTSGILNLPRPSRATR
jgi:quinolinate synthase